MSEFFEDTIDVVIDPDAPKKKGTYEKGKSYISYSQYATWSKCPASWKFDKIEKLGKFEGSIATVFGTAIHEAIQDFLNILYTKGAPAADNFDYLGVFRKVFIREIGDEMKKGRTFHQDETKEHILNGKEILLEILSPKNRVKHFPTKGMKLLGIETELNEEVKNNVKIIAFLDIVLYDEENRKIKIIDLKTSTNGWNKYQIADLVKMDQLLFYKKFYSKKYGTPVSDIDVSFIILKRKAYEGSFSQSKIQVVKPAVGKLSLLESNARLMEFVDGCFDDEGKKKIDGFYPKVPGRNSKNCRYCPFKGMLRKDGTIVCDGKSDK